MRPILLLVGCSMVAVAATAAYRQSQTADATATWAEFAPSPAAAADPAIMTDDAAPTAATPSADPTPKPAPLISLAPRGSSDGARFVKPPNSGG